jgi:hypothetical protein
MSPEDGIDGDAPVAELEQQIELAAVARPEEEGAVRPSTGGEMTEELLDHEALEAWRRPRAGRGADACPAAEAARAADRGRAKELRALHEPLLQVRVEGLEASD